MLRDCELVCSRTLGCGFGLILLLSADTRWELLLLSTSLLFFLKQIRKHMAKHFYYLERTLTSQGFYKGGPDINTVVMKVNLLT